MRGIFLFFILGFLFFISDSKAQTPSSQLESSQISLHPAYIEAYSRLFSSPLSEESWRFEFYWESHRVSVKVEGLPIENPASLKGLLELLFEKVDLCGFKKEVNFQVCSLFAKGSGIYLYLSQGASTYLRMKYVPAGSFSGKEDLDLLRAALADLSLKTNSLITLVNVSLDKNFFWRLEGLKPLSNASGQETLLLRSSLLFPIPKLTPAEDYLVELLDVLEKSLN